MLLCLTIALQIGQNRKNIVIKRKKSKIVQEGISNNLSKNYILFALSIYLNMNMLCSARHGI